MCRALNKSKNNRASSLKDNDVDNVINNNACYLAATEDNKNHHNNNVSASLNDPIITNSITTGIVHDIEEHQQNKNNDNIKTSTTATTIVSYPKKQNPFDNVTLNDS